MANRTFYPSQSYGTGRVYAEFRFTAPGASTSVATTGSSSTLDGCDIVSSIAHVAGTNVLTVTLKDAFPKVIDVQANIRDDAGNGAYATTGTITNEGTGSPITFKIQTFNAAGTALNDPTLVIACTLSLKNTSGWGTK